jgi:hypothetical protein
MGVRGDRVASGVIRVALVGLGVLFCATAAWAVQYQVGDVFAGAGSGQIRHFSPAGTLIETLNTTTGSTFITGMCFDLSGNLFATNFSTGTVSKFDNAGNLLAANFVTFTGTPESCVFDAAGNLYVGGPGSNVQKFSAAGALLATYLTGSSDWIDLAADQCTLFYDGEGNIHRWDICTDSALPDFTASGTNYAIRILPNGNVLAASAGICNQYDPSGTSIATYTASGVSLFFALNRDPDGISFWSADLGASAGQNSIFKFAINPSAPPVLMFDGQPVTSIAGLAVFGELVQGQPTPTPTPGGPTPTPTPPVGPAAVVPTLSGPMLAVLGVALALIALLVIRRY